MQSELDSIDQSSHLIFNSTDTCPRTEIMLHIDPVKRVAGYIKNNYKLLIGDQDSFESCSTTLFYPLNIKCIDLDIINLFDIFDDPNESTNIADDYPDIVDDLKADVIECLSHQIPLQCQLPTLDDSNPCDEVPYYVPWDLSTDYLPDTSAQYYV